MTMLTTSDGVQLAARSWSATGAPRASVVLVHGLAATKDNAELVAVANALQQHGLNVLAYDARGHGESTGICTLGDLERYDVAAAVAHARESDLPVVVVGASMGGIAVLRYAADDPTLAGVVTVSSPADWRLHRSPGTLLLAGMIRTRAGRAFAARLFHVRLSPHWTNPESPRTASSRCVRPMGCSQPVAVRAACSSYPGWATPTTRRLCRPSSKPSSGCWLRRRCLRPPRPGRAPLFWRCPDRRRDG